jgi:glutamine amidotransferase/cyclase
VRTNDQGDLVVTKGDQYDVREEAGDGNVRNMGKPVDLCTRYYQEVSSRHELVTLLNVNRLTQRMATSGCG